MFLWSYLKIRVHAVRIILEEGKSLKESLEELAVLKKQYSKLLKIHKQIGSLDEKVEE